MSGYYKGGSDGRVYTASAVTTSIAGITGIVTLLASSLSEVEILKLELSLASTSSGTFLPTYVEMFRGSSASTGGSTGSAITPANRNGWITAPASTSVVTGNSTTPNSTANDVRLHAGAFDQGSGLFCWEPCPPPNLDIMQRFHARITPLTTTPAVTMAMTLTFREGGKVPT